MELPPFNYPNPLGLFGGAKQVNDFLNIIKSYSHHIHLIYRE